MKKLALVFSAFLVFAGSALAVDTAAVLKAKMRGYGMAPELAEYVGDNIGTNITQNNNTYWNAASATSGTLSILKADGSDNTFINTKTGKLGLVAVAATPGIAWGAPTPLAAWTPSGAADLVVNGRVAASDLYVASANNDLPFAAGANVRLAPFTVTMAATPAAGTNDFKIGLNVVPTAAANTAALFPTPVAAGIQLAVVNSSGAAVRLKAGGTNTINGSAAGAYIPLAIAQVARCKATSTTAWYCGLETVPTPAGP